MGGLLSGVAGCAEVFRFALAAIAAEHALEPLPEHRIGAPSPVRLSLSPLALGEVVALGHVDAIRQYGRQRLC